MTWVYPVETEWKAGDLAYCVNPTRESRPPLERGRIYRIAKAVKPSNIAHHGLQLVGVDAQTELNGFWSNRFIKIGPVGGRMARISAATEYTMEHYWKRGT